MNAATLYLESPLSAAGNVTRFQAVPWVRQETLTDHIYAVQTIALILLRRGELRACFGAKVSWRLINEVLFRAYVHDLEETWTGDLRKDVKSLAETWSRVAEEGWDRVKRALPLEAQCGWDGAKDDGSEAAAVVEAADLIAVTALFYAEVQKGSRPARALLADNLKYLQDFELRCPYLWLKHEVSAVIHELAEEAEC